MRRTVDHIEVLPKEPVYEIMYRYFNAEASGVAEPEKRLAEDVPAGQRIWKHRSNCAAECYKINNGQKKDQKHLAL